MKEKHGRLNRKKNRKTCEVIENQVYEKKTLDKEVVKVIKQNENLEINRYSGQKEMCDHFRI